MAISRRIGLNSGAAVAAALAIAGGGESFAGTLPKAWGQPLHPPLKIDTGDTAWVLISAALVLLMTRRAWPYSTAGWCGARTCSPP